MPQVMRHMSFTKMPANAVSQPMHLCGSPASDSHVVNVIAIRSEQESAGAPIGFSVPNGDASWQPTTGTAAVDSVAAGETCGGGGGGGGGGDTGAGTGPVVGVN